MSIYLLNHKNSNRKALVTILCLIAICLSGVREVKDASEQMGNGSSINDTFRYKHYYEVYSKTSWDDLLRDFSFYSTEYEGRDLGYPIFMKLSQCICNDFTFFMFFTAAIFLVPLGLLIYKYVKSYLGIILSFLIYFTFYTNIVNSFMRQAVALGIVLFGVRYIIKSNWKKYFLLLLVAFLIHNSAVIAAPLYFLPKYTSSRKWILYPLFAAPFLMVFTPLIVRFISSGTAYEVYGSNDASVPVFYMLFLIISSFLTWKFYDRIKNINYSNVIIGGISGATILLPIVWMGGTVLRIGYYYTLFVIPLYPIVIESLPCSKNIRNWIYVIGILFFAFRLIR